MGLGEAIIQGSSLVREIREQDAEMYKKQVAAAREQGEAKGKAEGRAEGQREHSRRLLRNFLGSRYPGLEAMSEIDSIGDVELLDSLIERVAAKAAPREQIAAEIRAAAGER